METLILLLGAAWGVFSIALFVKLWFMTDDIKLIKNKMFDVQGLSFEQKFLSSVAANQKEKATSILFDEISKDAFFVSMLQKNEYYKEQQSRSSQASALYMEDLNKEYNDYINTNSDLLNDKYQHYLKMIGMEKVDFTIVRI